MIYKRGDVYWFEFQYDGDRIRQSTHQGNAQVARDGEAAARMKLAKDELGIGRKDKPPTLEEFKATFLEWVASTTDNQGTRDFYRDCFRSLCEYGPLGNARLDRIDEATIEAFKLWALKQERSRTTVNRYLATLRKALRYASLKRRIIDRVPVVTLYPGERKREYTFSDDDYQHWLEISPEPTRSASILAHDCGISRDELLALQRDCIVLYETPQNGMWGKLSVRRGLKRSSRRRDLPIMQDMAVVLHRLLAESKCDHVFTSPIDHAVPLSENCLQSQHHAIKGTGEFDDDAGIHALRHTFLTEAGRFTQNVRALQLIAGHANISTTMRYVHPDAQDVIQIAARVQQAREARISLTLPTKVPTVVSGHLVQ
jgi:integrase